MERQGRAAFEAGGVANLGREGALIEVEQRLVEGIGGAAVEGPELTEELLLLPVGVEPGGGLGDSIGDGERVGNKVAPGGLGVQPREVAQPPGGDGQAEEGDVFVDADEAVVAVPEGVVAVDLAEAAGQRLDPARVDARCAPAEEARGLDQLGAEDPLAAGGERVGARLFAHGCLAVAGLARFLR